MTEFGHLLTKQVCRVNIRPLWRGSSMVEQWTHKPLVVGSSPTLATKNPI